MQPDRKALLDPRDGVALRAFYESLQGQLRGDRSSWEGQWRQLGAFFAPRSQQWNYSDTNRGNRKDFAIINETGLLALRTLSAGMITGMSSQTRAWFKLGDEDQEFNARQDVRDWFEKAEEDTRAVFLKSNTYQTLLNAYSEEGLYGTTVFVVEEDPKTVIRCRPYPMGSYWLMQDDTLRVDGCLREVNMTVRNIVERFGYDNVSDQIRVLYDSTAGGVKETRYPIVSVIHKGSYFAPETFDPPMPWVSVWYEKGAFNPTKGVLRRSGFLECPLMAGRWKVTGENVYGESAGMDCLGSTMSLQAWEERLAQSSERQGNPTLLAGTEVDPTKITTLPGDIIFADTKDVSNVLRSAYDVNFKLDTYVNQIQRIEARINDAMFRSTFQMFSDSDRREITAEEIRAKLQEKMQVLGPVVERNVEEILAPLVMRTLSIMMRRGLLPPMPDSMKGRKIHIEFVSILAAAQKMSGLNNLSTLMNFVGSEVAVDQGIIDNVDLDETVREFANLADVPAKILRAPDAVAALRADRARQQQMAQTAENAQKLAGAAANLANAHTGTGSLLDQALPALGGGG